MEKITKIDEKFYGRLKSRSLTERQENLFNSLFKEVSISSFSDIDMSGYDKVFLEIGFGGGEHIAHMALNNPKSLFIGCEPFVNGVASLLVKMDEDNIKNIRIYQEDAKKLISEIPDNFLDGAFLLFPDPWPKRRHIKRRFIQDKTIKSIYRILKDGGVWKIATDHLEYQKWVLKMFSQDWVSKIFSGTLYNNESRPIEDVWPKTRYEQKSVNDILFAIYVKTPS